MRACTDGSEHLGRGISILHVIVQERAVVAEIPSAVAYLSRFSPSLLR